MLVPRIRTFRHVSALRIVHSSLFDAPVLCLFRRTVVCMMSVDVFQEASTSLEENRFVNVCDALVDGAGAQPLRVSARPASCAATRRPEMLVVIVANMLNGVASARFFPPTSGSCLGAPAQPRGPVSFCRKSFS